MVQPLALVPGQGSLSPHQQLIAKLSKEQLGGKGREREERGASQDFPQSTGELLVGYWVGGADVDGACDLIIVQGEDDA